MSAKILLIDDSEMDQKLILGILGKQHEIAIAPTLATGKAQLLREDFELLLLDVDLPDGNGFRFFAELRANEAFQNLPVVFITSKTETPDEVMGFYLGAEDYICKPFDPIKVRARIEARLKKLTDRKEKTLILVISDLKLDLGAQRAARLSPKGEQSLNLTPQEFKVLAYFMRHLDHVLSRDQLIEAVWHNQINVIDRTVDMHISNIRKKISDTAFTVKSVHGVGYRFTRVRQEIKA